MRHLRGTSPLAFVLGMVALVAAGCGNGAPSGVATTTTTTLPAPTTLTGSGVDANYAALGSVERVEVVRLDPGRSAPQLATDGTLGPSAVEIGYRQFGSGPGLLLVSGEHASMTSWDPRLLLALADHFRVTIFDFPDIGYSAPDPKVKSVAALADFTAGLIWSLGLTRPTVLGWGFGGEVALSLAERHPNMVGRLVLADATAGGADATPPASQVATRMASPLTTTAGLSRLYYPSSAAAARAAWLADVGGTVADVTTAGATIRQSELVRASFHSDAVANLLPTVRGAVLIVAGSDDVVVPPANARALARGLKRSHLVIFAAAGYAAMFEDQGAFVTDVRNFVAT